ncbi:MAG: gephyrin-like molybdotransferase Glp [Pyrinomonadaceae bacterium]
MIRIDEAIEIIEKNTPKLGTEKVPIEKAIGRILAEDVVSDTDMPPFDRSQMDGYAVLSHDTQTVPKKLRIIGESVAGLGFDGEIKSGEAVRIMTGARVPPGADSVQKKELTNETNGNVTINEVVRIGQNIVRQGDEIAKGGQVFTVGEAITSKMIASLAAFGCSKIKVAKLPRISILATGSEIVEISETPARDQIRNSNSIMLASFSGAVSVAKILPIAVDDQSSLASTISNALKETDCLLISGGVSVGDYDFTKPALISIGARIFFERVALKPGKPTVFAKLGKKLIFGLPGNPVSVAVTYFLFVRHALLKMQSAQKFALRTGYARLDHDLKGAVERDSLLPVSLKISKKGKLRIKSIRFTGSSNFITFAGSEALVFVPQDTVLQKGEIAEIYLLPE